MTRRRRPNPSGIDWKNVAIMGGVAGAVFLAARAASGAGMDLGLGALGNAIGLGNGIPGGGGLCMTIYPVARASRFAPWIEQVQPQIVQLHTGIDPGSTTVIAAAAQTARAAAPNARIWVGIGIDGIFRFGANSALETARRTVDATGAEAIVWNAEVTFKQNRAQGARIAQQLLSTWASERPGVPQGHTSYAIPSVHATYPWAAWLGGTDDLGTFDKAADFDLPQWYPFGDEQSEMIPAGRFLSWAERFRAGWDDAIARGWIRAGIPYGPYIASAYTPSDEVIQVCSQYPVTAIWPWGRGYDDDMLVAARALADRFR